MIKLTFYSFSKFGNCWKCGEQFEFDHSITPPDVNYCQDCQQSKLNPEIQTTCKDCNRKFKQFRANKLHYDKCQYCREQEPIKQKKKVKRKKRVSKRIKFD